MQNPCYVLPLQFNLKFKLVVIATQLVNDIDIYFAVYFFKLYPF